MSSFSLFLGQLDVLGRTAKTLNETIENVHVPGLKGVVFEDASVPPPMQIPWSVPFLSDVDDTDTDVDALV